MSATDELRRMLDERGVAHSDHYLSTTWRDGHGILHLAGEPMADGSLVVDMLTPEQAIAATLGSATRADRLLAELNNDRRINKQLKMANALLRKSEAEKIERIKALESLVLDWAMAPCAVCDPWDEYFACEHFDGGDCTLGIRMAELGLGLEVGE